MISVQFLKRQKIGLKKVIIRIFRQLPAKTSSESLDFSGLWKDTVEMENTRLRELTLKIKMNDSFSVFVGRNGEYPFKGIDTFI